MQNASNVQTSDLGTIGWAQFERLDAAVYPGARALVAGTDGVLRQWRSVAGQWLADVGLTKAQIAAGATSVAGLTAAGAQVGGSGSPVSGATSAALMMGMRVPHCRIIDNIGNASGWNIHMQAELEGPFVALRPVFFNTQPTALTINVAKVATGGTWTDDTGNALTWTSLTFNGAATGTIPGATSNSRMGILLPDWAYVASAARADGGTYPIAYARAYIAANAGNMSFVGNGSDAYDSWLSASNQLKFRWLNQSGADATTTVGSFTNTTVRKNGGILGFQYLLASGRTVFVLACGNSITAGFGATRVGDGWANGWAYSKTAAGKPVSMCNFGWNGQTTQQYARRALDALAAGIRPAVLVMSVGAPNDVSSTIAATDIAANKGAVGAVVAECATRGIPLILTTWPPANNAAKAYGATDSLRRAYNADVLAGLFPWATVCDFAVVLEGAAHASGQIEFAAGMTGDGLHPSQAGHDAMETAFAARADRFLP